MALTHFDGVEERNVFVPICRVPVLELGTLGQEVLVDELLQKLLVRLVALLLIKISQNMALEISGMIDLFLRLSFHSSVCGLVLADHP
jgi:hypothetical protein